MFAARGIHAVVGAEHHANLLGPIAGGFLSLDIWVDRDEAEDAAALLRDLRESQRRGDPDPYRKAIVDIHGKVMTCDTGDDAAEHGLSDDDATGYDASDDDAADDAVSAGPGLPARIERRRRTGLVLLLGCCFTFGTGHAAAGALSRGIALAAIEVLGLLQLWAGLAIGLGLVVAAVVADLVGALWIIHRGAPATLPPARIHRS
jgi:hypothetical protein